MADDKLPWRRSESIVETRSDKVTSRVPAISFKPFQKASSRLTLVLGPAMTIERLTTGDFIAPPAFTPPSSRIGGELDRRAGKRNNTRLSGTHAIRTAPEPAFAPLRP